jgi:hypothetical protein
MAVGDHYNPLGGQAIPVIRPTADMVAPPSPGRGTSRLAPIVSFWNRRTRWRPLNERPNDLRFVHSALRRIGWRGQRLGFRRRFVTPLASDDYAEYRDQGFLDKLEITLTRQPLLDFWPIGGPQWDALGRAEAKVILVEAKSHLGELTSACAAGSASLAKIQRAFGIVKKGIGAEADANWTAPYYQYANRLAHLFLLRELNGIDAELVLLCFVNDHAMRGPPSSGRWLLAFEQVHHRLGIPQHSIFEHVHHVFIDVTEIPKVT